MNDVQIGKASYGRQNNGFGGGHNWFYIEDNKDNIYRVLPPMKSLAASGKYAKYYRTHRGFRNSEGKQKPFICIEESNYKTKLITVHCPVCDKVADLEAEIKTWKERGATDEQIREFRNKNIFPFQAEGKYYLNVINQENKIGVLSIGSKMFKSLELLAMEQEKLGRDITGIEGVFLNFKKKTAYKGDRDAVHTAEIYLKPMADGSYRFVTHTITPDIGARLGAEAADLGNMFKALTGEQIAMIVSLEGTERAKYVDSLFAAPEQTQAGMSTVIPGTNMEAVSRVETAQNGGFQVQQPVVPANYTQQSAQAPANFGQFQGTQPSAPAVQFTPPASAAPFQSQQPSWNPPASPAPQAAPFTPPSGFGAQAPAALATPTPAGMGAQASSLPPNLMPGQPMNTLNDDEFLAVVKKR